MTLRTETYNCAVCDATGVVRAESDSTMVDCISCGGRGWTTHPDTEDARKLIDARQAQRLLDDTRYSDIDVLNAARSLLEDRGADTENLQAAVWNIRAATTVNRARSCEDCDNTGWLEDEGIVCATCDGSGYVS